MTRTVTDEASQFLGDNIEKYKVDSIPEGIKKLSYYKARTGREYKFTIRHYYVDSDKGIFYRYYPVLKICTAHQINKSKKITVMDDDDKAVGLSFGNKFKNHMLNETESWSKNNIDNLLKAWK